MTSVLSRARVLYGARPLHALVVIAALALGGYVVLVLGFSALWEADVWWQSIVVWFLGAVILHDLLLFPAYALADRFLVDRFGPEARRSGTSRTHVPALNYFRVPLLATGLLFLLFFPGIIEQGASSYARATGQTQDPFLERFLLLTALIFGLSALLYGVRYLRTRRRAT